VARRLPLAALVVALWAAACGAQPERSGPTAAPSADAVSARGPASAPVTIVEFSDYQ